MRTLQNETRSCWLPYFVWISILLSTQLANSQDAADVRVMSFNIRYGTAQDGDNHWDRRKVNVIKTITDFQPDVLGTQETLPFQAAYLKTNLAEYEYVGRSREANEMGEQCGILVRSKRFDILEQGHFWLSESPNVPGSQSWDSALPRMASWVKLFDRQTKSVFYFVNTHFDHRGAEARNNSAKVLIDRAKQFETGIPVVIAGDFNAGTDSKPYQLLSAAFVDTFQKLHPTVKEVGTFNGFNGESKGARIDLIFSSHENEIVTASIDRRDFNGRNPSDHFPVTCVLRIKSD